MRSQQALLTLFLSTAALLAQSPLAEMRGTITDTAGAPVAADMVIIDAVTGTTARTVSADDHGHYYAPGLRPGIYRITIDKERFQSFSANEIILVAGETRNLEVKLTPGSLSDTPPEPLKLFAGPPEGATVTNIVVPRGAEEDLPVLTLKPSPFPRLVTTPSVQGNGAGLVISGISNRNQQTWALDGIPQDAQDQVGNPTFFETVTVAVSNPGVESYRPVHFDTVSRHGAQGLHGLISYQRGSAALDSRSYFDTTKQTYKSHQLEGQIGGTLLPNRTWFYGAWLTQKNPYHTVLFADVPTTQMRNLDFSQFLDPSIAPGGKVVIIRDPRTGVPFPNNKIPVARFAPVAQKFMDNYYPVANVGDANTFTRNYTWTHPFGTDVYRANWPFARIDQRLNARNNLYFRFMQVDDTTIKPGSIAARLSGTQTRRLRNLLLADTHAFTGGVVNEFQLARSSVRFKQGEEENDVSPLTGDNVLTTTNLQGTNNGAFKVAGFPAMSVAGLTGLSAPFGGGSDNQTVRDDRFWNAEDTLGWSFGRHALKFGVQYSTFRWLQGELPQINYGAFNFSGGFTGIGFADFVLGYPTTSARQLSKLNRIINQQQAGLFLSDSFRVSSRLTFDIGVRWDYYKAPEYSDGYMNSWDPSTGRVIIAPGTLTAVSNLYPANIKVVSGEVVPKSKLTNFRPRLGAAYRITEHLVARGAYGEYTQHTGYGVNGPLSPNDPFHLTETYTNSVTGGVVALTFPKPFPTTPAASQLPGQSITGLPQKIDEGVIRQFNFTVERQSPNGSFRASYIGSRGLGMNYSLDINKARAGTAAFDNSKKPFPQFASAFVTREDGKWKYDSAVLEGRRNVGPVALHASFTLANNVSNYANTIDPYNVTNKWTRDGADRRAYFVATGLWDLPLGKGKRFLGQAGKWTQRIASNWSVQAIATAASGQYYTPYFNGPDPANATPGFITTIPDCVGDPNSGARTIDRWFNPSAFAIPLPGAGRYGTCGMNSLEGYPIRIGHVSLVKTVPLGEYVRATFTAQITNVTNTAQFITPNNNLSTNNPGQFTPASLADNTWAERLGARQVFLKIRFEW
jgi:hypothetical protein